VPRVSWPARFLLALLALVTLVAWRTGSAGLGDAAAVACLLVVLVAGVATGSSAALLRRAVDRQRRLARYELEHAREEQPATPLGSALEPADETELDRV
jgi:hypothetical protein